MAPNNGDVLAMANYPNFDLSNPRDLSAYYTEEELAAMDDDAKMDALNQLWQNFCVSYTYEPGSTAKPFTVSAGLETGTVTTADTYYCDGYETISGHDIHCVKRDGHGMETLEQTLMNSCNDALMQMSYKIGRDNFENYQQIFGFGQKTNIDLPGETRTDSLIYTGDNMTVVDLATNAFGQNFNTTMIQLATGFCSIVNGGKFYQPHVVKRITDENGNVVLGDEMLTPDSSRFWPLEGYEAGKGQPSFDKQFVRDWLKANPDNDLLLPDEVVEKTVAKYKEAFELLTGKPFQA